MIVPLCRVWITDSDYLMSYFRGYAAQAAGSWTNIRHHGDSLVYAAAARGPQRAA